MRYIKYFVFIVFSLNVQATELNISTFNYVIDSNWEKISVLPGSSVLLRSKTVDTIVKTWKTPDLFQDNSEYTNGVLHGDYIYSAKNFIDCITKVKCKSKSLKKYIEILPAYDVIPSNPQSICNNENLTCVIFPSVIPTYQFEAFVYNKANEWEFIRVTTTNKNKDSFKEFINNFTIKGL